MKMKNKNLLHIQNRLDLPILIRFETPPFPFYCNVHIAIIIIILK